MTKRNPANKYRLTSYEKGVDTVLTLKGNGSMEVGTIEEQPQGCVAYVLTAQGFNEPIGTFETKQRALTAIINARVEMVTQSLINDGLKKVIK